MIKTLALAGILKPLSYFKWERPITGLPSLVVPKLVLLSLISYLWVWKYYHLSPCTKTPWSYQLWYFYYHCLVNINGVDINIINLFLLHIFPPSRRPINSCAFLSCRSLVLIITFSTGLVGCWSFFCLQAWAVESQRLLNRTTVEK